MNIIRLKDLRNNKGLTQGEVAVKLGFSQQRYGFYETGKREPDNDTLVLLAEYYGVSTDYLLGNTDDPTPPQKEKAPSVMTTEEAIIAYFKAEKGREPTAEELSMFLAFTKPVLDSLPDKAD